MSARNGTNHPLGKRHYIAFSQTTGVLASSILMTQEGAVELAADINDELGNRDIRVASILEIPLPLPHYLSKVEIVDSKTALYQCDCGFHGYAASKVPLPESQMMTKARENYKHHERRALEAGR